MNFIVTSPFFPENFQQFSVELHNKGITVLGIGEEPYQQLGAKIQAALTEYYRVDDMNDRDEVKRAVAFFYHKYGKIDRIESQNEHWLELDADLRTEFNVLGINNSDIRKIKYKSEMKKLFDEAGVPTVEGAVITTTDDFKDAVSKIGYPSIVKPDNGVGAAATFKLENEEDSERFLNEWDKSVVYFMEPFVSFDRILTYDGLLDQDGEVAFETSLVYEIAPLDLLTTKQENVYFIDHKMDDKLKEYGRKIIKAFGFKERFFHIELFQRGNDYIALEYNCRPAGGNTIDAYNYAYSINLYEQYANIVKDNQFVPSETESEYCLTVSRRDEFNYRYSNDDIRAKYGDDVKLITRVGKIFSEIMGDDYYCINCRSEDEIQEIIQYVLEKA
ncbi:ATP-grasp domain-containing protein [Aerococcaceae bacterium DSM 111176]|nr:ATP-grasp domain-containing protein [Aerococcaceae bacterium DSM 111176]